MPRPNTVRSRTQLLVEGNDQRNFFEAMISHLKLDDIQVQNFGGVDELQLFVSELARSGEFPDVRSLGIVRDAETSAQSAFRSVQGALARTGLAVPHRPRQCTASDPAVSVLILPDDDQAGMLESILCRTFAGSPLDACIDNFFDCIRDATGDALHRPEKARAHAYIATQRDSHVSVGGCCTERLLGSQSPCFQRCSAVS